MLEMLFKKIKWYHLAIVGLLIYILLFTGSEIVEVKIPSKENSFEIKDPIPEVRIDTVEVEVLVNGKKVIEEKIVEVENPVNKELLQKYEEAVKSKDSLQQLKIFKEAVKERRYTETLQDSVQTITVKSEVVGTLKSQSISYKTKEQVLKVKVKKIRPSIYVGGFSRIPTIVGEEISFGVQLNIVNKRNSFGVGFDNQKNVLISYTFNPFSK